MCQRTCSLLLVQAEVQLNSMDSGMGVMNINAAGKPYYAWDADNRRFHLTYYPIGRQLTKEVLVPATTPYTSLLEQMAYGEGQTSDKLYNLRGQLYLSFDGVGQKKITEYDFESNPLHIEEQLLDDPTIINVDWASSPIISTEVFNTETTYDALNRPITITDAGGNITRHQYDASGKLFAVYVTPTGGSETTYVSNIYYNAKEQRLKIYYGNGTNTAYSYNNKTFRLTRLLTKKATDIFQDLNYWYDPVGNITTVRDDAHRALYFSNSIMLPEQEYTYDALYPLVEASRFAHWSKHLASSPIEEASRFRLRHPLPHPKIKIPTAFFSLFSHFSDGCTFINQENCCRCSILKNIHQNIFISLRRLLPTGE